MHRRGFSLASILLLMAVIAVFMASVATVFHGGGETNQELAAGCALAGLAVGLLVGCVVGYNQGGTIIGMFVGMISGGAAGALLSAPESLLPITFGSVVLVLFGVVVRLNSGRPPKR